MLCQCLCLCLYLWLRWCSGRRMARPPARLGVLTSFGAAPRSPPVPSGPSGALHTGGACGSGVPGQASPPPPMGAAARPRRHPRAPQPGPATAHGRRSQAPPRSPPVPSGPSGPSATAASGYDVRLRVLSRSPAWPRRRLWVLRRVLVKEISPQHGALVRGTALH